MNDLTIEPVESEADAMELDTRLWDVLWRPFGLPRNVRESFKLEGESLGFVAKSHGKVLGGLVATWTSPTEVKLRHIALKPEVHNQGAGSRLVNALIGTISQNKCTQIRVIARGTSTGFFRKLGFTTSPGKAPEHPAFKKHRITFELMEKISNQFMASDGVIHAAGNFRNTILNYSWLPAFQWTFWPGLFLPELFSQ